MADDDARQSTDRRELERQIMDSNVPKNEREWWTQREITALREQLAETLRETDAIIEPFARFLAFPPQGAWDGPNIAMGDFQRADKYRRKRLEQTKYKGGTDG